MEKLSHSYVYILYLLLVVLSKNVLVHIPTLHVTSILTWEYFINFTL